MASEPLTRRGLQAAVALATAESTGLDLPLADVLGDCPVTEALRALAVLAGTYMRYALPSAAATALRTTGATVARLEADG